MKIARLTEQKIKETAKTAEVIGDFYDLRKAGTMYECLCPFHADSHLGSFKIDPKRNTYHCYACGAHGDAIDFLRLHEHLDYTGALVWLARRYSIDLGEYDGTMYRFARLEPRPLPPPLPALEIPRRYAAGWLGTSADILCNWLRSLPWNDDQRARIEPTLKEYAIGHTQDGYTVFWQVTPQGTILNAHMMRYLADGHRDKSDKYGNTWAHSYLARREGLSTEGHEARYTLFGCHLARKYTEATVNVVESEKTALLCAIYWGNSDSAVWMATGGMQNLTAERLKPLTDGGRQIVLYPDMDGEDNWRKKAEAIGGSIIVNAEFLESLVTPDSSPKADLGDIITANLEGGTEPEAGIPGKSQEEKLEAVKKENPAVKALIEKLGLELSEDPADKEDTVDVPIYDTKTWTKEGVVEVRRSDFPTGHIRTLAAWDWNDKARPLKVLAFRS